MGLRWLNNNVNSVYLTHAGFLASFWSVWFGLVDFFRFWPWLPIGLWIVQILRQRRRKTTNTAPTALSATKAARESTFIYEKLYYRTLLISRNDKIKQLTLLCQFKLALTAINNFLHNKIIGAPKKLKTSCVP